MLRGLAQELTGEEGAAGRCYWKHHNPYERDSEQQEGGDRETEDSKSPCPHRSAAIRQSQ
jgi:hypothetical protein